MALADTGLQTAIWPEKKEKFSRPIPLRKTGRDLGALGLEHALLPGAVTMAIVQCDDWPFSLS